LRHVLDGLPGALAPTRLVRALRLATAISILNVVVDFVWAMITVIGARGAIQVAVQRADFRDCSRRVVMGDRIALPLAASCLTRDDRMMRPMRGMG
jgi:hypothetical protein